jgi:hypothetical protein
MPAILTLQHNFWGPSLFASIFIIVASSALFLYWFRHTCLLILAQRESSEYALKVASTIRLNFPKIEDVLQTAPRTTALDRVHAGLEDDYRILTDLLRQATENDSIQHRVLAINYKAMKVWYRLNRTRGNLALARNALTEMSSILGFFADELGQSAAA